MDILTVNNLTCGYGGAHIIKNVSFNVREGEFIGIIGPNGAGKTTLFRAVTGLLSPERGNVAYRGRDISRMSPRDLAREVAVIPQVLEVAFAFSRWKRHAVKPVPDVGFPPFACISLVSGGLSHATFTLLGSPVGIVGTCAARGMGRGCR